MRISSPQIKLWVTHMALHRTDTIYIYKWLCVLPYWADSEMERQCCYRHHNHCHHHRHHQNGQMEHSKHVKCSNERKREMLMTFIFVACIHVVYLFCLFRTHTFFPLIFKNMCKYTTFLNGGAFKRKYDVVFKSKPTHSNGFFFFFFFFKPCIHDSFSSLFFSRRFFYFTAVFTSTISKLWCSKDFLISCAPPVYTVLAHTHALALLPVTVLSTSIFF